MNLFIIRRVNFIIDSKNYILFTLFDDLIILINNCITDGIPAVLNSVFRPFLLTAMIVAVIMGVVLVCSGLTRSLIFAPLSALPTLRGNHQTQRNITSKDMREPIEVILNLKVLEYLIITVYLRHFNCLIKKLQN